MKRSTKRRLTNGILYGILLLAFVLLGALVNWTAVKDNFFDSAGWGRDGNWDDLITIGVKNTIVYTFISFVFGFALAIVLALMKLSPVAPYRWLATAYIEFFRGLPALIVILVMAFGVPIAFGWSPPGGLIGAGLIALILVSGAYMAETLRAGIQAVPKGQSEAARSLGMSAGRTTLSVILPQAFRIVIPPLTNELILLVKDSSLVYVVGVTAAQYELTKFSQDFLNRTVSPTPLLVGACCYLAITLPLSLLVRQLERRYAKAR